ncbi:hypothetical protein G7Z17_g2370 [Cylindrodendrum hubeiense]|uniref:Uncharacterized protein n=1 Tax=Cylindrodendrum hubeiense TaxID=595255 RepID=A0A9P5HHR1_9HYPO|nr:hypothetical protein G7Z17_g2370 [Cylindrodendrum hubeiense]
MENQSAGPSQPKAPESPFDMHPPNRPGIRFALADKEIDPADVNQRRSHLNAFYRHMWQLSGNQVAIKRKKITRMVCDMSIRNQEASMGTGFLELRVDRLLWWYLFHSSQRKNKPVPAFPWPELELQPNDPADPPSEVYRRLLEKDGEEENAATPNLAAAPNPAAVEAAASATNFVPDMIMRQRAWDEIHGEAPFALPLSGPFELFLPTWFDFKGQVWGAEGAELNHINSELIDEKLAVGWAFAHREPGSNAPIVVESLIVGFARGVTIQAAYRRSTLASLSTLWKAVCDWGATLFEGHSRTLARHIDLTLRVQIGIDRLHLPWGGGPLVAAYTKAQQDVDFIKKKTLEHQTALQTLRGEVVALSQGGFTAGKVSFWALQGFDLTAALGRIDVAEQILEASCNETLLLVKILEKTEQARQLVLTMGKI